MEPEQIAHRLPVDFPDDASMRISHEAIYQALYVQSRGALKRELVYCLRTGRALRVPRARSRQKAWAHVTPEVLISERPAEAEDRAVPGHWEGDLLIGLQRSAIGTLVERTTRFTMLIHLPREEGFGVIPRTKNGPPLAGYGAVTMKNALAATITTLPEQLRRSLTWDRGKELSAHAQFTIETRVPVYFADPHSPWQRARTRTRTDCYASTSRRAPTCLAGTRGRSTPSRPRSTTGRGRHSAGRHPPKPSTSSYCPSNKSVLRRPVEPSLAAAVGVNDRAGRWPSAPGPGSPAADAPARPARRKSDPQPGRSRRRPASSTAAGTTPRSQDPRRSPRSAAPGDGPVPPHDAGTLAASLQASRTPPRDDHRVRPGVRESGSGS